MIFGVLGLKKKEWLLEDLYLLVYLLQPFFLETLYRKTWHSHKAYWPAYLSLVRTLKKFFSREFGVVSNDAEKKIFRLAIVVWKWQFSGSLRLFLFSELLWFSRYCWKCSLKIVLYIGILLSAPIDFKPGLNSNIWFVRKFLFFSRHLKWDTIRYRITF